MEQNLTKKGYNKVDVDTYVKYVNHLKTAVNRDNAKLYLWATKISDEEYILLFEQAKELGLTLDGDTVTIENKGQVKLNFNYQAYKNLVLVKYPETVFDIQLVYQGDTFNFKKENGKVIYNHTINNPFDNNKKIVGAYCIIKNRCGEFIEIMNEKEILKCKNCAKTKNIWEAWESEMYKKTIIKRSCKTNFKDVVLNIDRMDNEDYDLSKAGAETKEDNELKNTPFNIFLTLLNSQNKTEEEKAKLIDEWNMTDNNVELQRVLYNRIKTTGR
jgi:hypothetical protein